MRILQHLDALTYNEMLHIERMALDKLGEQSRLFLRLLPYLNGRIGLEEICWRERVSRRDVMALIEASDPWIHELPFLVSGASQSDVAL
jgi:hypothetical protein